MAAGRSTSRRRQRAAPWLGLILFLLASAAVAAENRPLPFSIDSGRLFTHDGREIVFSSLTLTAD